MIHERILRSSIAAVIEGRIDDAVVKCSRRQKIILEDAAIATISLRRVLNDESSCLNDVMEALNNYKRARKMFESAFKVSWPM